MTDRQPVTIYSCNRSPIMRIVQILRFACLRHASLRMTTTGRLSCPAKRSICTNRIAHSGAFGRGYLPDVSGRLIAITGMSAFRAMSIIYDDCYRKGSQGADSPTWLLLLTGTGTRSVTERLVTPASSPEYGYFSDFPPSAAAVFCNAASYAF